MQSVSEEKWRKIEGVLQGEGNVKIRFVNRKLRAVQGADVKIDGMIRS